MTELTQVRWTTAAPAFTWSVRRGGSARFEDHSLADSLATAMPVFNAHSAGVAAELVPFTACRDQPRIILVVMQTATPQVHA